MGYNNFKRRVLIFFAIQYSAQPFGLFCPVFVVDCYTGIFNIGIRLVLSRIQNDKTDRTLPECIVDILFFWREIALELGCKSATCFVVASCIIHRNLRGKQLGRRIHKTVEDMIFLIED